MCMPQTQQKIYDTRDDFSQELSQIFDHYLRMVPAVGTDIFKMKTVCLHETNTDNWFTAT
jgi:hypothetical protein